VEAFLMAVVVGNMLVFLFVTTLVAALVLSSSLAAVLIATRHLLGSPRGPIPAAAGSRLGVAMWNDIADILDERR